MVWTPPTMFRFVELVFLGRSGRCCSNASFSSLKCLRRGPNILDASKTFKVNGSCHGRRSGCSSADALSSGSQCSRRGPLFS